MGFIPTVPQKEAGCLIEPPVSVPNATGAILAATAEADPPEEPPGTSAFPSELQGLVTVPK